MKSIWLLRVVSTHPTAVQLTFAVAAMRTAEEQPKADLPKARRERRQWPTTCRRRYPSEWPLHVGTGRRSCDHLIGRNGLEYAHRTTRAQHRPLPDAAKFIGITREGRSAHSRSAPIKAATPPLNSRPLPPRLAQPSAPRPPPAPAPIRANARGARPPAQTPAPRARRRSQSPSDSCPCFPSPCP